jgi:proteasome assembly chaperone (PAC2) family protein
MQEYSIQLQDTQSLKLDNENLKKQNDELNKLVLKLKEESKSRTVSPTIEEDTSKVKEHERAILEMYV